MNYPTLPERAQTCIDTAHELQGWKILYTAADNFSTYCESLSFDVWEDSIYYLEYIRAQLYRAIKAHDIARTWFVRMYSFGCTFANYMQKAQDMVRAESRRVARDQLAFIRSV